MAFWIPWTIDALAAMVLGFFFFAGLADGSVSSFNIGIWLAMLGGVGAILSGSWWLRSKGRKGPAVALAWLLAVPALLVFAFFAAFIVLQPDFR